MLSDLTPMATLAAADLQRSRKFYEGTLGMKVSNEMPEQTGGITYQSGEGKMFVYESQYAGTNKATAVSFHATPEQFDKEVEQLRAKGVSFLTFEFEGIEWDGDVATMGEWKSVWFTDPDGNILNLGTM
jgi:catechol 2,3-dioxygenase-like lactoylglutathione lyase family enzyme